MHPLWSIQLACSQILYFFLISLKWPFGLQKECSKARIWPIFLKMINYIS
jgi:hypothetical protein